VVVVELVVVVVVVVVVEPSSLAPDRARGVRSDESEDDDDELERHRSVASRLVFFDGIKEFAE
jgi:hypothetical protein